jgi:hypothetical protein
MSITKDDCLTVRRARKHHITATDSTDDGLYITWTVRCSCGRKESNRLLSVATDRCEKHVEHATRNQQARALGLSAQTTEV